MEMNVKCELLLSQCVSWICRVELSKPVKSMKLVVEIATGWCEHEGIYHRIYYYGSPLRSWAFDCSRRTLLPYSTRID